MRNAAAALVAFICWAGLAIQFNATFANRNEKPVAESLRDQQKHHEATAQIHEMAKL